MRVCHKCGGEIEFRYDYSAGRGIPIHLSGACSSGFSDGGYSEARRPENYLWGTQESYAAPTECPHCRSPVFFVRHNGGCVWLNDLGWPWPKHECFLKTPEPSWASFLREKQSPSNGVAPTVAVGLEGSQKAQTDKYFVGVVVAAKLLQSGSATYTGLAVEGAKKRRMCVAVVRDRAPASYLDCLVVINITNFTLSSTNHRHVDLITLPVKPSDLGLPPGWLP